MVGESGCGGEVQSNGECGAEFQRVFKWGLNVVECKNLKGQSKGTPPNPPRALAQVNPGPCVRPSGPRPIARRHTLTWLTSLSLLWLVSPPRRGASASISSKKRTQGAAAPARAKSWRTARSLSPTYLLSSSGPLMEMKLAPDAAAAALATSVFPQPGGESVGSVSVKTQASRHSHAGGQGSTDTGAHMAAPGPFIPLNASIEPTWWTIQQHASSLLQAHGSKDAWVGDGLGDGKVQLVPNLGSHWDGRTVCCICLP